MDEIPFTTDYAKSSRSVCRGCSKKIVKDTLRLAINLPAPTFDGTVPNWYHYPCFFLEQMPMTVSDISNFGSLKPEDRHEITKIIDKGVCPFKKEDIEKEIAAAASEASAKDYTIEYTPGSSRSKCNHCSEKLIKAEMRVSYKPTKKATWYHFPCFVKICKDLQFLECGNTLSGFESLEDEDKKTVEQELPGYKSPAKKKRISLDEERPSTSEEDENAEVARMYREELKANLEKDHLVLLLKENRQSVPSGIEQMLDRASDMLTYGAVMKCPKCKYSQLVFSKTGYRCNGYRKGKEKCDGFYPDAIHTPVVIPMELQLRHEFLQFYEYVERKRKIQKAKFQNRYERKLLYYKNIVLEGFSQNEENNLRALVKMMGGRVVPEVRRSVLCVVATEEAVAQKTAIIETAKTLEVYVVSRNFLQEGTSDESLEALIKKYSLCDWGAELHNRIPPEFQKNNRNLNRRPMKSAEEEITRKVRVKNGVAIERDSGLENIAHVYQSGSVSFNAVLSRANLQTNKNSFYKIQLLESDDEEQYWLYTSWGRIGTDSAGHKLETMADLATAIDKFKELFKKWTGNNWEHRHYFMQGNGMYNYVEVDYQPTKDEIVDLKVHVAASQLEPAVADLMALIFNVSKMEKLMLEYELNVKEMPLGKLSRLQIKQGYDILRQIQWLLDSPGLRTAELTRESSRFYSTIPHSAGLQRLPLLDNKEIIKKKCEMLENLMEIETAYSMIQRTANDEEGNPLDSYYKQLKSDIVTLKEQEDEYRLIEEYVQNTHAQTHSHYDLKILEIFKVQRHEEEDRYKPFTSMPNRKLLWHGSRVTNYAGILSQGLRIAPPEAPTTGYMFGKGIYFADMVSKSANYCCTTSAEREGLILLCEVALGNMVSKYAAENVKKLPTNMHSVKGVGKTYPDPQSTKVLESGVEVPLGKPITNVDGKETLLYNEYIVYDPAQVNIKYLLKLDFKYKHN